MFFKRPTPMRPGERPSRQHQQQHPRRQSKQHSDQLPFMTNARFSALPKFQSFGGETENLTLFIAVLYVVDLFGVFPLITLPGLFVKLGFFGIPLVISVLVLQIYTSFLLSQCWIMAEAFDPSIVQKSRYPYAALADLAFGPYTSMLVTVLIDLSIFSTGIPNLLIAAQNLELVGERISDNEFRFSFCYWLLIIGLLICPPMWMGSPKHMRGLTIMSVWVIIVIIILLWFCLFSAEPMDSPFQGIRTELPSVLSVLRGYSILAFQFDIHPMLITLQIDMQDKSQVYWAAFSGIIITFVIGIFGSLIAAYKFGAGIADNLLETLPKSVPLFILLILMAMQLCFSSVVGSSAMFLQFENYFKVPEELSLKRIAIRSSVVGLEVLIAEFLPNFDVLMGVVGGTITGPLVFILPPLLYRRLAKMERLHRRIIAEAGYGSIPFDMSCERLEMELLQDNGPNGGDDASKWTLRYCWNRLIQLSHKCGCDLSTPFFVLLLGIAATFFSTYLNFFQLSELFHNNSPCFGNFTQIF